MADALAILACFFFDLHCNIIFRALKIIFIFENSNSVSMEADQTKFTERKNRDL